MLLKLLVCVALAATNIKTVSSASKTYTAGIERLSLNAERSVSAWIARGINSTGAEIQVPATVPGGIYSDLEDDGIFNSPIYHEYNDAENRWVGRMNWSYSRNFTVTSSLLQKTEVVLVCEGLDTVSDVFVNDELVGRSENMFVRYVFDVRSALKVGENTIRVAFTSPVEYAKGKFDEHNEQRSYPVVPESQLAPDFRGESKGQMIRKMQSSFAWDWGPSYPNSGIWKDIYIEGYSGAVIRDVMIFNTPSKDIPGETEATRWNVTARVYYDSVEDETTILTFNREGSPEGVEKSVDLKAGKGNSVDISLIESGDQIQLWWPNGYGEQHLYWYNVSLASNNNEELSSKRVRFGFRTVELNEDFVDAQNASKGREFHFKVNGMKMYSKGSNSIPLHVLPERVTEDQTEWMFRAAKYSHQNMIRVWGGGIYESEDFFDYADECGIFIWEDFMFACSMYPATPDFRENVRKEVDTQVKRLQHRTSLALWAGNNENEAFLRFDLLGTAGKFPLYYQDYVRLYIDTIKVLVEELDPSRAYITSSPTNGKKTEEEGWVAENPGDLKYGDLHFYDYTSDNWDWRMFYRTRYASEYGFQSFPHFDTLAEVADNISSWTWESPQMQHRQHHPNGQYEIREYIRAHFPFPENYNSTEAFPYMLYMAQLTQAMGQKTETEFYRRLVDKLDEDGTGHNMGALYWQLNDIWEGCSWASIEVNGRWKILQYYAMKFFSPVLASPYRDLNGDVVVELISDLPYRQVPGPVRVKIFKLSSMTPVYDEKTEDIDAEFLTAPEVHRVSNTVLSQLGCAAEADSGSEDPCVVYVTYREEENSNFLFLQYPKNKLGLKDPNHKIESVQGSPDGHEILFTITTEAVAPFVFLTVKGEHHGYFSDNGFLQTTGKKDVIYYSENGITPQQFLERLEVMSLFDVTKVAGNYPSQQIQARV